MYSSHSFIKFFNISLIVRNKSNYQHQFRNTLMQRQQRLLDKFENEIRDTMEKIKTNQKVRIKRKKSSLSMTTKTLMTMNLQSDQSFNTALQNEWNYPTGSPEQLVLKRTGLQQSFLTSRMRILNTNFLRATAEIFATDEVFHDLMNKYKFNITNVRVSSDCQYLQIYWANKNVDERNEIGAILNNNKGRLHELLSEMQYTHKVPWIQFVFDLQASNEHEIEQRLEKCRAEFETNCQNINQEQSSLVDRISKIGLSSKDDSHDDPKQLKYETKANEYDCMEMPADMFRKNVTNLDYEALMSKVLQNMPRARAQHQEDLLQSKTLSNEQNEMPDYHVKSDSKASGTTEQAIDYDTENRIKAIKKFVKMNRKKKDKLERKLKLAILSEEIGRFDDYESLREQLNKRYEELYTDQIENIDDCFHYKSNDKNE